VSISEERLGWKITQNLRNYVEVDSNKEEQFRINYNTQFKKLMRDCILINQDTKNDLNVRFNLLVSQRLVKTNCVSSNHNQDTKYVRGYASLQYQL
jgi:hypothetical protein